MFSSSLNDNWMVSGVRYLIVGLWTWAIVVSHILGIIGNHNVKVLLDWGLATCDFLDIFQDVKVTHVQTMELDHCALLIECAKGRQWRRRKRQFRYENMWRSDPMYMAAVQEACLPEEGPTILLKVRRSLDAVQGSLQCEEANVFGSVRPELVGRGKNWSSYEAILLVLAHPTKNGAL